MTTSGIGSTLFTALDGEDGGGGLACPFLVVAPKPWREPFPEVVRQRAGGSAAKFTRTHRRRASSPLPSTPRDRRRSPRRRCLPGTPGRVASCGCAHIRGAPACRSTSSCPGAYREAPGRGRTPRAARRSTPSERPPARPPTLPRGASIFRRRPNTHRNRLTPGGRWGRSMDPLEEIRKRRLTLGIGLGELARAVGRSEATISRIERG